MTNPTLPVSRVVSVAIQMAERAAALRNFGAMLVLGASDVIDVQERIRAYSTISEVVADFGTSADEYKAALAFFSQSPQPSDLYIGRWAKTATYGLCRGKILSTAEQAITNFTSISAGGFTCTIDGQSVTVSNVDLSSQSNLNGVAAQVTDAMSSSGSVVWDGSRFIVKSVTSGASSSVSVTFSSTPLSMALGLATASENAAVNGVAAESLEQSVTKMLDFPTWYGLFVASEYTQSDALAVAALIEAASPSRIFGATDQSTAELDQTSTTSLGYVLEGLGYKRTFVMYSSTNSAAAMSVLGRMSTVNFEGSNTCITLKFKQCPGVTAEFLTTTQANALQKNNVNVFAEYQNDTAILQEGTMAGGWFIDETHGLDWLQNRVETDLWNLLYTSTTKIGQDESGITAIISTITKSLDAGVRNGLIAPGVWNGDSFGSLETGDTLSTGYYIYVQPLAEQARSDREARKCPPVQIAVKLKGAIHFVDVTINVNR